MAIHVYQHHWNSIVMAKALNFQSNTTLQLTEVEALYQGVQFLMAGSISHFILPHESLAVALDPTQRYLTNIQPHMTLSHRDLAFYYNQAAFETFRKDLTLFLVVDGLVVDVLITTDSLAHTFQLYDVIKLPLSTPEMHDYSMLATVITTVGFARDADHFIQMTNYRQPIDANIWYASDVTLTFLDRNKLTCARGLIECRLADIKATCRYRVHKSPHPHLVNRLHGNTFLLTNISQLRFHCPQQFGNDGNEHLLELEGIQTIHKFDCHCDMIHADEFSIIPDLNYCNDSDDITSVSTVHFPINLAYLSEYFTTAELFNSSADTLLNDSIDIQVPNLAIADKFLDKKFANEEAAAFDMAMVVNSTKTSAISL